MERSHNFNSMSSIKESSEKPDIKDFKLGQAIGEGNFSQIVVATHVTTHEVFALKIIEKKKVKRLRIRHANIFNEINMEKEVLNKLRHPNIIRLYHTFQDNENLYFLLEYLEGGELLTSLVHEGKQIGVHPDLARFYLTDIVNAIEYIHANQIIHRDLKPENMVVSAKDGHIRLIDFGTAKDLVNTTLNGPHFVGTPEYMSPETIDNKPATFAADMWALGCIIFQLLAGETPFMGGSAYLTFLKVQRARYRVPDFLTDDAKDLIRGLLKPNPDERYTIADVKSHPFFNGIDFANHMSVPRPTCHFHDAKIFQLISEIDQIEKNRCENIKGERVKYSNDLVQPKIVALSESEQSLLQHLLNRKQILHYPSIYPRFFNSPILGRCMYARDGGYIGFTHLQQNKWTDPFRFVMIAGPRLGKEAAEAERDGRGGSVWESELSIFCNAITATNALNPAFVVISGDFINANPSQDCYAGQINAFQELVNDFAPEIKLVFVPGADTATDESSRNEYEHRFGDTSFSFWYGGVKFIISQSPAVIRDPERAIEQEEWLTKELENGKLCARETVLFATDTFYSPVQGPELPPHLLTAKSSQDSPQNSQAVRRRCVEAIAKNSTRLIVTTQGKPDTVTKVHTIKNRDDENDERKSELLVCSTPFTTKSMIHVAHVTEAGINLDSIRPNREGAIVYPTESFKTVPIEKKTELSPHLEAGLSSKAVKLEITSA